jgi:uracil-DNA glycosylase family 4
MTPDEQLALVAERVAGCTRCELSVGRKKTVPGAGSATPKLLLIGEAPGAKEDMLGLPFVGQAGSILDRLLAHVALERSDVFITNIVKCRPTETVNGRRRNREPREPEILACHPYLNEQLAILLPRVIVTVGKFATNAILCTSLPISSARQHVWKRGGGVVVPTFHPAVAIYRGDEGWNDLIEDFELVAAVLLGQIRPDREAQC